MIWFWYGIGELIFLALLLTIWFRPVSEKKTGKAGKTVSAALFGILSATWTGMAALAPNVTLSALVSLGTW